jgi:hypothetical protein
MLLPNLNVGGKMKSILALVILIGMASVANASLICKQLVRGHGQTVYHANGSVATYSAGSAGATWYFENGNVMTYSALNVGSTTYHQTGAVLSYSTGSVGATWYHANGRVFSYSMGSEGATWYDENGSVITYSGPALDSRDLWEEACQLAF